MTTSTDTKPQARLSPIVELRQYDLVPGTRDTLIGIFDSHLVEGQEMQEMAIIGQFRDLDNPDSFVWLRGFDDMEARKRALAGFYSGPVWMANRDAANATMLRFDNVLPAAAGLAGSRLCARHCRAAGGRLERRMRGRPDRRQHPARCATIVDAFAQWHRENMLPLIEEAGAEVVGVFVTEPAENTYPALPVHTDRKVLAIFSRFADAAAQERTRLALAASPQWAAAVEGAGSLCRRAAANAQAGADRALAAALALAGAIPS